MDSIMNFLFCYIYVIILTVLMFISIIVCIIAIVKYSKLNKNYKNFMMKVGNGKDIQEDMENFIYRLEKLEKNDMGIQRNINELDTRIQGCIQKVGIVRYNAFKDTGSDLSFAIALLDEKNNGVIFNGIYSREMSNIYAKPVENGKSNYTLSDEEKVALQKAVEDKRIYGVE